MFYHEIKGEDLGHFFHIMFPYYQVIFKIYTLLFHNEHGFDYVLIIDKFGNQIFRVFSWKLKLHTALEINR